MVEAGVGMWTLKPGSALRSASLKVTSVHVRLY